MQSKYNAAHEIIDTIRLVAIEFPDLKLGLDHVLNDYVPGNYENIGKMCDKYNKVINQVVQMVCSIRTVIRL